MTPGEAKKDVKARLDKAGIVFDRLTARTVGFGGFGYGNAVFVTVHGAQVPADFSMKLEVFNDVPKPSLGGYCVEYEGTQQRGIGT